MLRAGELNRQIHIEQPTVTRGSSGGPQTTWQHFAGPLWAAVRNLSGNEKQATAQGGEVAEARTEFRIRWRGGITAQMRVVFEGRYYNIRHVNHVNEARELIVLTCDTGVNDG